MGETQSGTLDGLRVVIIGGVAGGMSTATRLRRLDADARITVIERSGHVSFANCGLPYFVGGLIEEEDDLTLQTPTQLFARFRLDVHVNCEVIQINRDAHTLTARSTVDGTEVEVPYDKLVLSMGAAPVRPPIPGYDRVRTLRTVEDAARLAADVDVRPTSAVVIGAWLAVGLLLVPLLTYYNTGYKQFGYRFSLDFMAPLMVLLALALGRRAGWFAVLLMLAGVVVNAWGVWAVYG